MKLVLLLVIVAVCAAWPSDCGVNIWFPTARRSWDEAHAVFVGQVENKKPAQGLNEGTLQARALEPFKGVRTGETFHVSQASFCLETQRLEPGDRALFYLFPRPNGTWNAFRRTRPLDQSADDLLFIRALPHSLEQTRLSGTVRNIHDKSRTMPGIPVTATGEGVEVTTHTNGDGVYEFYGLPEGRYDVRIEPAPFYRAEAHASRPKGRGDGIRGYILDLEAGLSVDFRLLEDYQISGRVLVPETSPLPPRVSLKSTGGARIGVSQVSHDGAFSFTGMPAGTYLITFPGSNTGLPVSIGRGQKLEGVLIPFPPPPVARPADQMRQ